MNSRIFTLAGPVVGKGRPRIAPGRRGMYSPRKTREYEKAIQQAYRGMNPGAPPLTGPVKLTISARVTRPNRPRHNYPPRPDLDNIVKVVCDALNGLAWKDDSQIVVIAAEKQHARDDGLLVVIQEYFAG